MKHALPLPMSALLLALLANSAPAALKSKTNLPFTISRYEELVSRFQAEGHNLPIVFLGDSRVSNADWNALLGVNGTNRGIAGDTTTGVVERLAVSMPDPVNLCVIQLGINDVSRKTANTEIVKNFRTILAFLAQKHARVLLTPVVPIANNDPKNAQVKALNQMLKRLANGTTVQWVDINEKLAPQGSLEKQFTVDNVHFTPEGYAQIAAALKPLITP